MIDIILIIIGLLIKIISLRSLKLQELDKRLVVPITDTTHIGVGAFVANLTTTNQLAAILGFILYLAYQLLDYIINKDTVDKDILTFAIGFFGALGYKQLF